MDSLFHFVFSMICGMAVGVHLRHRMRTLVIASLAAVLMDVDHFFGLVARGTFHNVFVVFVLPLALFLFFFHYENRWFNHHRQKSIRLQTFALLLLVMMTSHVVADTFVEGQVKLFYPLSDAGFTVPPLRISVEQAVPQLVRYTPYPWAQFVSREGVALALYAIIIMLAAFIEDVIYFFERKHERLHRALRDAFGDMT